MSNNNAGKQNNSARTPQRGQGRPMNMPQNRPNARQPMPQNRQNPRQAMPQNRQGRPQSAPNRKADSAQRRQADRAYNQAVRERSTAPKRRRKTGNFTQYYIAAGIVAVLIFAVLANTVLFNCGSITVEGSARYSTEDIIAASGIKIGDNLLHIDTKAAEERVLSGFAYIDTATVSKKYPTGILITVGEAEQWYYVSDYAATAVVSRLGKIVDNSAPSSLVRVVGYEPVSTAVGEMIISRNEGKSGLPATILQSADSNNLRGLTEIDITDRFEITLKLGDRISIRLGDIGSLDEKLHSAVNVINNSVSESETVYVDVRIPDQVIIGNAEAAENPPQLPEQPETAETAETAEIPIE